MEGAEDKEAGLSSHALTLFGTGYVLVVVKSCSEVCNNLCFERKFPVVYRTVKSLLRLRIGLTLILNEISLSEKYARLSPRTIFTSEVRHPNDRVITQYQTTVEVARRVYVNEATSSSYALSSSSRPCVRLKLFFSAFHVYLYFKDGGGESFTPRRNASGTSPCSQSVRKFWTMLIAAFTSRFQVHE